MSKAKINNAIHFIDDSGILLVYPINNRKDPESLWSKFHPRTPMRWEWDDEGDNRVADMWYLRTELSLTKQVVYTKWFQGRATFFSKEIFTALLRMLGTEAVLSRQAQEILEYLKEDSPLSTKEIKVAADLRGRSLEPIYNKAMKELWSQMLIVGYGEKDDGAFPSLAVGATSALFEDLWIDAQSMVLENATRLVEQRFASSPSLTRFLRKTLSTRD